jgi:hypothetical protein
VLKQIAKNIVIINLKYAYITEVTIENIHMTTTLYMMQQKLNVWPYLGIDFAFTAVLKY